MKDAPRQITLREWDERRAALAAAGLREPPYGGPLGRHAREGGDARLFKLRFDDSTASLRLWNFLLTEEERLHGARAAGRKIVGTMKDLGTVPVMAYALPGLTAFYPDGAWWTPCVMELSDRLFAIADSLGVDDSFCPVRAMLGAFVNRAHFPIPDLLTCSVGATCDDFSAIAQRVEALGHPILWWEMPHRRAPEPGEAAVRLPGGFVAPREQVDFVRGELERIKGALEELAGQKLDDRRLAAGIDAANQVRAVLAELRLLCFTAERAPLPALELLVAEMLAIHFCSDRDEALAVLGQLLAEVHARLDVDQGFGDARAVRVYWVNPVADLRLMNLLEECGGRLCGTEYLFCHALDRIPTDLPSMEALARMALADPMAGPASDRARRVIKDARRFGAEALVIARIPGASHCASEGQIIREAVQAELGLPVVEIEVPPLSDPFLPSLKTRLEALVETARSRSLPPGAT